MTNEEVILILNSEIEFICNNGCGSAHKDCSTCPFCDTVVAFDKAIKVLKKQIKRRPYAIEDETYGVMKICPECSFRVIEGLSNFCINCGTGIDWSDEE